jgi:hypothetical protein
MNDDPMSRMRRLAGLDPQPSLTEGAAPPALLLKIAQKHFDVETLATRKSDRLDFHDVAVWSIESALQDAYEAGFKAGKGSK